MDAPIIDPVEYPRIVLGGTEYELKFRCFDIIDLKKNKEIDVFHMETLGAVEGMERTLVLLQSAIAHQAELTIDELAKLVDFAALVPTALAINAAIGKASPQATVPSLPAMTPASSQPN